MTLDAQKLRRHSVRLPAYDYAQPGAYFVTIVAAARKCLFGRVVDGDMLANAVGDIVRYEWEDLPRRFQFLELGAFVVMPNHFHGILIIHPPVGATLQAHPSSSEATIHRQTKPRLNPGGSPLQPRLRRGSLGAIIAQFKPRVTKRIWKLPQMHGLPVWQRNYYEHVIRNETDWNRIHRYIEANSAMWAEEEENPAL